MKTVLVFKTSVTRSKQIRELSPVLNKLINPYGRWNFDLEDCDRILRVETRNPRSTDIVSALQGSGFICEEL
ncbi:MAG: hypothetical protein WBG90_19995 [Saonia sp.]